MYIHCNFCLNLHIIHEDVKETVSMCFFLKTVYFCFWLHDLTISFSVHV